jgi:oligoendopeptidase F
MTPVMDWSLESFFPSFDGPEYRQHKTELHEAFSELRARIEAQDGFEPSLFAGWQAIVLAFEEIGKKLNHLSAYLECLSAADAANEAYHREQAGLASLNAELAKLEVALVAAFGAAKHEHFEAFLKRDALASAEFSLRRWREKARRMMSPEEEALAAELEVDGIRAWSRLYDTISGTLEFPFVHPDGRTESLPMSRRRSLLASPDRAVRAAAFEGGNLAWRGVESVCAAALNAIAGARLTLVQRRNQRHFLEPALFEHRLGMVALDALREALLAKAEISRSTLRRKAARMGEPAIAWFDLEAPTPGVQNVADARLSWEDGRDRVGSAFIHAYPALGVFFHELVGRRWIDHTPRRGKRPGGFCTTSMQSGESRIFMTFDGVMNDVVTLAHEAGHAWHSQLLRDARPLARGYPMTLAESASTFAEMLLIDGVLNDPAVSDAVKLQVLDSEVRHSAGFLLDVPMRFEFERRFYEERAEGEVSVSRLKALMVEAQRKLFGDALAQGAEDPLFWASKLHFYIADVPFYNFPYTVGFLLSRALFARFKKEGAAFLATYETFLARSGSATCETLAKEILRADLESPEFWAGAIESVSEASDRLEALLQK